MKRLLFFVAFMTLGTAALIELLVREPLGPSFGLRTAPQVSNVLNMQHVEVHQLLGDKTRWELQADQATYNENTNSGELQQVRFRVFGTGPEQAGQVTFAGRSGQALLSTVPGDLVLQDAVVLTKGEDMEIRSERLEYDAAKQVVTSPGPVRVRTREGVQEGTSLRYSMSEDRLELTSPVFYQ
jgi:LPS export ABC transporter protein LptC